MLFTKSPVTLYLNLFLVHLLLTLTTEVAAAAAAFYTIGKLGKPWDSAERAQWAETREIQRSYQDEVVEKIISLKEKHGGDAFHVQKYGSLSQDPERYPLYVVQSSKELDANKPNILITGGVHGASADFCACHASMIRVP